jgi:hypothetical protein
MELLSSELASHSQRCKALPIERFSLPEKQWSLSCIEDLSVWGLQPNVSSIRISVEGLRKIAKKISARRISVPVGYQTGHNPKTNHKLYSLNQLSHFLTTMRRIVMHQCDSLPVFVPVIMKVGFGCHHEACVTVLGRGRDFNHLLLCIEISKMKN